MTNNHEPLTSPKTLSASASPQPSRKRSREAEQSPIVAAIEPSTKRARTSEGSATRPAVRETQFGDAETPLDPVEYWRKNHNWPKEYFEPKDCFEPDMMSQPLPRKRSTPSLGGRKRSVSGSPHASSTTPSDQKPREEKSAPYNDPRYKLLLQTKGSFMAESDLGITEDARVKCLALLQAEQTLPTVSLFQDDIFNRTCLNIQDRNEARVVQDITRLIVPSAETLATFGARTLDVLVESVNEGWNHSIALTGTRPQPDYSVGFKREAFSEEQLEKLAPFIGNIFAGDQSFFMATYYMYFPFLTCEVKCGTAALEIADRQNAHSMTLAVRAVVELFRLAKREAEIDREILAFSISHDHESVRIYGHYPVIKGKDTTFYRHPIRKFVFTEQEGKEKWSAYRFTKNVYTVWMPTHLKRLCSVIDELPQGDFDVASLPPNSEFSLPFAESISQIGIDDICSSGTNTTSDTSFTEPGSKRSKGSGSNYK